MYTASTLSLAALELLANTRRRRAYQKFVAIEAQIPPAIAITRVTVDQLPANWREYPPPRALQELGTRWAADGETAVLAVPSAVVPRDLNYLLNPRHPDFKKIRVGRSQPFSFDPRLWTRR